MMFDMHEVDAASLPPLLPIPDEGANKYSRGKLYALGGSAQYPGAISLAACAAERMGAGYVEVFCAQESILPVRLASKSLVVKPWERFTSACAALVDIVPEKPQACLVGSGFSGDCDQERALLEAALTMCAYPVVIDGGAISYLATDAGRCQAQARGAASLVATPHVGEAARLSQEASIVVPACVRNPAKITSLSDERCEQMSRWAKELASAYGATVVLKTPDTFIASADTDRVEVMRWGSAALSKAGTGDVLAGLIASLLAQGMTAVDACVLATSLHALSAAAALRSLSEICLRAEDIICFLPEIIGSMLRDAV